MISSPAAAASTKRESWVFCRMDVDGAHMASP
jgi:hypothetical protein